MNSLNFIVNAVGIIYGLALILATFVCNRLTESLRIDALFVPQCSESTRPLNLVVGLVIAGYGAYSLLTR